MVPFRRRLQSIRKAQGAAAPTKVMPGKSGQHVASTLTLPRIVHRLSMERYPMADLVPGTLEMMILSTLTRGEMHGYGIAQRIQNASGEVLSVEEGSLYPALQRLLGKGWVTANWGLTGHNRRARFYKLTRHERRQLGVEVSEFRRTMKAIERVLE